MGNTAFLLGIKISVILLHLWEDIPSLKSSTASPTWRTLTEAILALGGPVTAAVHPTQPTACSPRLLKQSWNGWDSPRREAADRQRHRSARGHAVCTAGSLPVLLHHHSNGCEYHLFLLQKGHRLGLILFRYLSDLPWTALNTWQKWAFKKLIFKNQWMQCSNHSIQGIGSSLGKEGMTLTEEKEKLIMTQGKRCFSDTILILSIK